MARSSGFVLKPNALAIKAARTRSDEQRSEWRIEGCKGLVLRCLDTGAASWWYVYRHKGRIQRAKIGSRDTISLKDAIEAVNAFRHQLDRGQPPNTAGRDATRVDGNSATLSSEQPVGMTFEQLYRERLAKVALKPRTIEFYKTCIEGAPTGHRSIMQMIGRMPVTSIKRATVLKIINAVEERGSLTAHDQAKLALSAFLGWAVNRGYIEYNPVTGIADRSISRPRVTKASPSDLAALWQACSGTLSGSEAKLQLSAEMKIIIKLAMLTGQRRIEVAGARVSELALDSAEPTWTLPGNTIQRSRVGTVVFGRTKNGHEHSLPLSRQVVGLWRDALALRAQTLDHQDNIGTSERRACVFPSSKLEGSRAPHIHAESVTKAMIRTTAALGIKDVSTHDLRRTFATWAGDNGVPTEVVSRILNHTPTDVTRRHYMQSRFEAPARKALQDWADYVVGTTSRDT